MKERVVYDIEVLSSMAADCGSICAFSWKEHGKERVRTLTVKDYPKLYDADIFDDSALVQDIANVLVDYNVLIGHNAKSSAKWGFDLKYINTRLILHGLSPIKCIAEVDTLQDMAKKHMKFRSNKLSELAKALGLPEELIDSKNDMDFPRDWNAVIVKKPGAMTKMIKRNKVDVILTEMVYNKLLPICDGHPNIGFIRGYTPAEWPCPTCGECDKINNKDRVILRNRSAYQRLICRRCNKTYPGPTIWTEWEDQE